MVFDAQGTILFASARWCDRFGYSDGDLTGKPVRSVLSPGEVLRLPARTSKEEIETVHQKLLCLRKGGEPLSVACSLVSVPGSDNWFLTLENEAGNQTLEKKCRESEWRFRSFVEHNPDILVVIRADRTFGYMNPAVQTVLGYEPAELAGWHLEDLMHPDDQPRQDEWPILLSRYGSDTAAEVRVRHKDGSWRHLEVVAHNFLYNPVISGVVVYGRDVTNRIEASRKIRQYAAETAEHHLEVIGRLHRAVSERGNASLMQMLGDELLPGIVGIGEFAECLLQTRLDATQTECAEEIRDSARMLDSVVKLFVSVKSEEMAPERQRKAVERPVSS